MRHTYSLLRNPGRAVLPPTSAMLAQKRPCRSSGRSAMLDATVEGSPDCCSPAEIEANHTISMSEGSGGRRREPREKEMIIADVGRMEENLWNSEPLVVHR